MNSAFIHQDNYCERCHTSRVRHKVFPMLEQLLIIETASVLEQTLMYLNTWILAFLTPWVGFIDPITHVLSSKFLLNLTEILMKHIA